MALEELGLDVDTLPAIDLERPAPEQRAIFGSAATASCRL